MLLMLGVVGLLFGLVTLSREWSGPLRPAAHIDLSYRALPRYAFFSLSRGLIAYALSLLFTLFYGFWAAKDKIAERILVPLLDILQSIPVLGFMPGLILALVALFPHSNIGLEMAAIIMIFTGQVWNMTFSFYHSLRSVPPDLQEAATLYRFDWWRNFKWLEVPFSMTALVWNSMMSMAGGWFFLMINEAFVLGNRDFRLPGIGSYMSVAVAQGNSRAMIMAILTMTGMIVLLDQFLWRPVVVWSQKFRVEDTTRSEGISSWFLNWLRDQKLFRRVRVWKRRSRRKGASKQMQKPKSENVIDPRFGRTIGHVIFLLLILALIFGGWRLVVILSHVSLASWARVFHATSLTLGRVLIATAAGTLWAVPAGLAIGLSSRLSKIFQPIIQVVASFPAPMLFPIVIGLLHAFGVPLGWGSICLMLLGTQWYILFNVIAGAMFIPSDLKEAAEIYRMSVMQRFRHLYLPAVFPYLVTGWVTAAGGAWNASIVSEYVSFKGSTDVAFGIGSEISKAAGDANFPLLAAGIAAMSFVVVLFNRIVWKRCYAIAETRFSLAK